MSSPWSQQGTVKHSSSDPSRSLRRPGGVLFLSSLPCSVISATITNDHRRRTILALRRLAIMDKLVFVGAYDHELPETTIGSSASLGFYRIVCVMPASAHTVPP